MGVKASLTHEQITIEIANFLLDQARRLAAIGKTTVRALVEQGRRQVLSNRKGRGVFKLRRATFKGRGLQGEFVGATWEQIRDAASEGRGGWSQHR